MCRLYTCSVLNQRRAFLESNQHNQTLGVRKSQIFIRVAQRLKRKG